MTAPALPSIPPAPLPANVVPALPETAPFTPEQRAYLNGFLAGLFSRVPVAGCASAAGPAPASALRPLTILYGSQTGNAEALAKRAAKTAGQRGFAPTVCDLAGYDFNALTREQRLLLITSTYGDGEPPDNARAFVQHLLDPKAPRLPQLQFALCGLGDTHYEKFCQCAKDLDHRLAELGGRRVTARADCDADYDAVFPEWLDRALHGLGDAPPGGPAPPPPTPAIAAHLTTSAPQPAPLLGSRLRPLPAALVANLRLSGMDSDKETRQFTLACEGPGLAYEVGDALGVQPLNCPLLVEELLTVLGSEGNTPVPGASGAEVSLRQALQCDYEITRIPHALLRFLAERTGDDLLKRLTAPNVNGELTLYLRGREVIDLLLDYPAVKIPPREFVGLLKRLQPRLYSIASSPKVAPARVDLTVAIVRYVTRGRARKGVCSTFLADRAAQPTPVSVFLQPNPNFRLPTDHTRPIIMIGPGTGIAPFRAFLQERAATGAPGRAWLFFGDQHQQTDFLYRAELEAMLAQGTLTRLETAFSRDQERKVYVQHRMLEQAQELYAWLEAGAHLYVCGDAQRMAKDVEAALLEVVTRARGCTQEAAAEFVSDLKAAKRYQRDVY